MKKSDKVLLTELDAHTDRWTILVRVFRRWNIFQKANPNEIAAVTMVLIDEEVRFVLFRCFGCISNQT